MLRNTWNYCMKEVVLKKCSCSYDNKKRHFGKNPNLLFIERFLAAILVLPNDRKGYERIELIPK